MNEEGRRDAARAVETGLILRGIGSRRRDVVGPDGETTTTGETDVDHRLQPAREVQDAHQLVRRMFADRLAFASDTNGNLVITPREGQPTAGRAMQEAWGIIIDARLAAQTRRGITEEYRAPITRGEAADLLRLPRRLDSIDEREFGIRIRAAITRAEERYGPYANMALRAALQFSGAGGDRNREAVGLISRALQGREITRQDLERLAAERRLRTEEDAWRGYPTLAPRDEMAFEGIELATSNYRPPSGEMTPDVRNAGRPYTQAGPLTTPSNFQSGTPDRSEDRVVGPGLTASMPRRRPPPEEIQYLLRNPTIWREFDRDYGPGSAAEILQQLPQP